MYYINNNGGYNNNNNFDFNKKSWSTSRRDLNGTNLAAAILPLS